MIEDETPLDGGRIDIPARIGWLLRVSRMSAGLSLREMSVRLKEAGATNCSSPVLSRHEANGIRNGHVTVMYESVLGLPQGSLLAAIDTMCANFAYAPSDVGVPVRVDSLDRFDEVVEAVSGDEVTGQAWRDFADAHGPHGAFCLNSRHARPLVGRLASELGRSVGHAYTTRCLALSRLRKSRYGGIVEDVTREYIETPGCQVMFDLMGITAEVASPELFDWLVTLLEDPWLHTVKSACLALESLRSVGGVEEDRWLRLGDTFVRIYNDDSCEDERRALLSRLYKQLPPRVREAWVKPRLRTPIAPVRSPESWSPSWRNRHHAIADSVARAASDAAGLGEQPMATRLLFESLFDFRSPRSYSATLILGASPLRRSLVPALLALIDDAPDDVSREGAAWLVVALMHTWDLESAVELLERADPPILRPALSIVAAAGIALPDPLLRRLVADESAWHGALYTMGMSGHPLLAQYADDATLGPQVRPAARWWLEQGPRITV